MAKVSGKPIGVLPLQCPIRDYAWGKIGHQSTVAMLANNQPGFKIQEETPYAELWMGSHPRAPSTILNGLNDELLGDWIKKNPSSLGNNVYEKFGANLPYLFKVLSINKALSLQIHPTKEKAEILHQEHPDIYPDPNHKPEMAIALTEFELFCGFRPAAEILNFFHEVVELLAVVGQDAVDKLIKAEFVTEQSSRKQAVQNAIKLCLSRVLECNPDTIREHLSCLVQRLNDCHEKKEDTTPYLGRLFLQIHGQYPGDVGCFVIYFLNYIKMEPYESIYFGPNVPHAYLSGDIVECMACSDNVIRAGLTPKYKDVTTLLDLLDYTPRTIKDTMFIPQPVADECTHIYNPPVDDFSVKKILIDAGSRSTYNFKPIKGPSILLTISGKATLHNEKENFDLVKGAVHFVSSDEVIRIENIDPNEEVLVFQAYCDLESLSQINQTCKPEL